MKQAARGFTLIELLLVVAIIGIIAAIAIPGMLQARMSSNEASAIGSVREIVRAQVTYSTTAGRAGYAILLATLARPCPNSTTGFISEDLATDPTVKSGYTIALGPGMGSTPGQNDCNGTPTVGAYYVSAAPLSFGTTGQRSFAANTRGSIWQSPTAVPPAEPFGPPATPLR